MSVCFGRPLQPVRVLRRAVLAAALSCSLSLLAQSAGVQIVTGTGEQPKVVEQKPASGIDAGLALTLEPVRLQYR